MNTQLTVDAASRGAINNKIPEQAYKLFEIMANDNYMKTSNRNVMKRPGMI